MARLCSFTDMNSELVIYVNPSAVRYIEPEMMGGGTSIVFDADHSIVVTEQLEVVVRKLDDANRT